MCIEVYSTYLYKEYTLIIVSYNIINSYELIKKKKKS